MKTNGYGHRKKMAISVFEVLIDFLENMLEVAIGEALEFIANLKCEKSYGG